MPCYDPRTSDENAETQNRLDHVTRLLCGICTELENADYGKCIEWTDGLPEWWKEHKKFDAERKR